MGRGTEEMAQPVRVLAAFVEDLGAVASISMEAHDYL